MVVFVKKTVAISAAISLVYRSKANGILLALLAAACVCTAGAKCTFDFSAASERLYGGKVAGADLLAGQKWSHHAWMSTYDIKRTDPRWKTIVAGVRKSQEGNAYETENPPELLAALGGEERFANMATSSWGRSEERRVGKECRYRWSPYH